MLEVNLNPKTRKETIPETLEGRRDFLTRKIKDLGGKENLTGVKLRTFHIDDHENSDPLIAQISHMQKEKEGLEKDLEKVEAEMNARKSWTRGAEALRRGAGSVTRSVGSLKDRLPLRKKSPDVAPTTEEQAVKPENTSVVEKNTAAVDADHTEALVTNEAIDNRRKEKDHREAPPINEAYDSAERERKAREYFKHAREEKVRLDALSTRLEDGIKPIIKGGEIEEFDADKAKEEYAKDISELFVKKEESLSTPQSFPSEPDIIEPVQEKPEIKHSAAEIKIKKEIEAAIANPLRDIPEKDWPMHLEWVEDQLKWPSIDKFPFIKANLGGRKATLEALIVGSKKKKEIGEKLAKEKTTPRGPTEVPPAEKLVPQEEKRIEVRQDDAKEKKRQKAEAIRRLEETIENARRILEKNEAAEAEEVELRWKLRDKLDKIETGEANEFFESVKAKVDVIRAAILDGEEVEDMINDLWNSVASSNIAYFKAKEGNPLELLENLRSLNKRFRELKRQYDPIMKVVEEIMGKGYSTDLNSPSYKIGDVATINFEADTFEQKVEGAKLTTFRSYHDFLTYLHSLTKPQREFIESIAWGKENPINGIGILLPNEFWDTLGKSENEEKKQRFLQEIYWKAREGQLPDESLQALVDLKKEIEEKDRL